MSRGDDAYAMGLNSMTMLLRKAAAAGMLPMMPARAIMSETPPSVNISDPARQSSPIRIVGRKNEAANASHPAPAATCANRFMYSYPWTA